MVAKKKSIVFLLSDFQGQGYQKALEITARKHDLIPVLIQDNLEKAFRGNSFLRLKDLESQQTFIINARDKTFKTNFAKAAAANYAGLKKYFLRHNLDLLELTAGQPYLNTLINFFRRRTSRRQY